MTNRLKRALTEQKQLTKQETLKFTGILGIPIGGSRVVEVPNRKAFVYVRLRDNQNEVIQAYNNQVAPSYNLPVIVERIGNKYIVSGVDTERYENNWNSYAPYLPRHGNTHSFDMDSGGGGDIVWVYPRQFMPALVFPSGSLGGPNVIVSPYTLKKDNGTWRYIGNTGTQNITLYNPTSSTGAIMGLVYLNTDDGNPYFLINSGSVFSNSVTGSSQIVSYIPTITNPANQIPLAAIRLITGTYQLSWDNVYDVRQFIHNTPTGTGASSIAVQDEGAAQGTATTFNFVGDNVQATVAGSVARIFITGSIGGGIDTGTLDARYLKLDASNDPVTGRLQIVTPRNPGGSAIDIDSYSGDAIVAEAFFVPASENHVVSLFSHQDMALLSLEQEASGTVVALPVANIFRYGKVTPATFTSPVFAVDDTTTNASFYGGTIEHKASGTVIFRANPQATGTVTPYLFNTQHPQPTGTILVSWQVRDVEKARLDVSGTFYSNNTPLVKEAPVDSQSYVRKNAGWEVSNSSGDVGGWVSESNTWTFHNADSPSYVVSVNSNITGTVGVGMKVQLTHQSQTKNFFATAVSVTGSTTYLNLYGGTDFTLNVTGSITNPKYSYEKAPFGFPVAPSKWSVTASDSSDRLQTNPVQNTWYNLGSLSINIPIGVWSVQYNVALWSTAAAAVNVGCYVSLSTANNSESDTDFRGMALNNMPTGNIGTGQSVQMNKTLSITTKTTYYLISSTPYTGVGSLYNYNSTIKPAKIICVCAYL